MKRGDVPGNVTRDAGNEFGEALQFIGGIVEAGNQEGDNFEPQAHLVDAADAIKDRRNASAEFVVVAIVEAFEIHLVEIEPRSNIVEYLLRSVAVGNE